MSIVISTDNCYEGLDVNDNTWYVGSYEELEEEGRINIAFSFNFWEEEKKYFSNFVKDCIKKYESRYRTEVLEIALCGKVGLWNHSPIGGRIVSVDDVINMGQVDSIDVTVSEDGTVLINGYHHDGTHTMGIYLITESLLKETGYWKEYEQYGVDAINEPDFFQQLYEMRKPLVLEKKSKYYTI